MHNFSKTERRVALLVSTLTITSPCGQRLGVKVWGILVVFGSSRRMREDPCQVQDEGDIGVRFCRRVVSSDGMVDKLLKFTKKRT